MTVCYEGLTLLSKPWTLTRCRCWQARVANAPAFETRAAPRGAEDVPPLRGPGAGPSR